MSLELALDLDAEAVLDDPKRRDRPVSSPICSPKPFSPSSRSGDPQLGNTPLAGSLSTVALSRQTRVGSARYRAGRSPRDAKPPTEEVVECRKLSQPQVFQRYFDEVANDGNLDRRRRDCSPRTTCTTIRRTRIRDRVVGPQGVKRHLKSLMGAFPDLQFVVDDDDRRGRRRSSCAGRPAGRTPATTSACPPTKSRSRSPA